MVTINWTLRDVVASKCSWWVEKQGIRAQLSPTITNKLVWGLIRLPIMRRLVRML